MSLQEQIDERLKASMKARDARTVGLLRMLKARMTETTTAVGFSGPIDDALWLKVIEGYAKMQKKAIEQFALAGEAGRAHIEAIEWEVALCEAYLPKKADTETMRGWVRETIAGLGGKEVAKVGAVMGAVMKAHKDEADAAVVKALVAEELAG